MDDRGIVILMVDEKMSPTIGKQLLKVGEKLTFFYPPHYGYSGLNNITSKIISLELKVCRSCR